MQAIMFSFQISIHPPHAGRDGHGNASLPQCANFNPPSPCGEGQNRCKKAAEIADFNPPSPCGEGPRGGFTVPPGLYFNPPSPCGEGPLLRGKPRQIGVFQSTLPMRGGTIASIGVAATSANFNPPSPCGEGPGNLKLALASARISIHPPHAGRDARTCRDVSKREIFQSTLPMRGGTHAERSQDNNRRISIHPPHAGRDTDMSRRKQARDISIHPPHAGRDGTGAKKIQKNQNFNPPSPCGEGRGYKGNI